MNDRNLVVSEGNVQIDSARRLNDRSNHRVVNLIAYAGLDVVANVVFGRVFLGHGAAILHPAYLLGVESRMENLTKEQRDLLRDPEKLRALNQDELRELLWTSMAGPALL